MNPLELTELLYNATRSRFGTIIETNDAALLRQRLYAARKDNQDFVQLSFVISPMNGLDLWIVNKGNVDEEG